MKKQELVRRLRDTAGAIEAMACKIERMDGGPDDEVDVRQDADIREFWGSVAKAVRANLLDGVSGEGT